MASDSSVPGQAVPGSAVPGNVSSSPAPPGWPGGYYTVNFCPNPSAESGTAGYGAVTGGETLAWVSAAWSGQHAIQVTTPGAAAGEGIMTPAGTVLADVSGCASVYVYGDAGQLTLTAVQNPGGHVLASVPVQPAPGGWQRAQLDQLPLTEGSTLSLLLATTVAQAMSFTIDAVQYEPQPQPHPYADGDQPYGTWAASGDEGALRGGALLGGAPSAGATSYQQYQNPVALTGGMALEGSAAPAVPGAVSSTGPVSGQMDASGQPHPMAAASSPGRAVIPPATDPGVPGLPWEISGGGAVSAVTVTRPGAAVTAFAVYQTGTDPDPAMTLIGTSNAGTLCAGNTASGYARVFGTFSAPRQVLDSTGSALWQSAAYMSAGFAIAAQAPWSPGTPNGVNFTQVQAELATGPAPAPYQRPRSLLVTVKPTQLNYVPNPSAEVSLAGWTAFGGAALTRVSGGFSGSWAFQVSVPAAGGGAYVTVPELILGDAFTASAYIQPVTTGISDVIMGAGGATASASPSGYPFGGEGYGTGPYGGVNPASGSMATGSWAYRPWLPFTAPASTVQVSFTPVAAEGASYPLVFQVDAVMTSPGEVPGPYGDGSSDGWQWELGGTPGLTRSYYYERQGAGASAVQAVLDQHVPLGLSACAPAWALPPTQ